MSAARHLELVPDPDDAASPAPAAPRHAEDQFIGSLMWLNRDDAQTLLFLVPANAIWQPTARWAYELITATVEGGHDPTPVAVKAAGCYRRAHDAIAADRPPTARQQKQLAHYLFETYSQALGSEAAARGYACEVLDDAYRRAFDTFGIRMQELAACGADRDDLTEQFTKIRDELATLWRLAETAAQPERTTR
jgi:hypothetical protein